jgi:hypothetical protein
MSTALNHDELEERLIRINPPELGCRGRIAELRRLMDEACYQRTITMSQWRSMLDRISLVQAKLVRVEPDAWRRPPASS